jgi:hypothetical protein
MLDIIFKVSYEDKLKQAFSFSVVPVAEEEIRRSTGKCLETPAAVVAFGAGNLVRMDCDGCSSNYEEGGPDNGA